MSFGKILASLRKEKEITQQELANALDISRGALSMYELDKREPDNETLLKFAQYFDVSADYLLGQTNQRKYETQHTAFHTTSVDGLDESDIMLVENLIKSLKEKHKK